MIPQHVLVVTAKVDPSIEGPWNDWYDNIHMPEIMACPGFIESARFVNENENGERFYLSMYQLESADTLTTPEFAAARGWGPFTGKVDFVTRQYAMRGERHRGTALA